MGHELYILILLWIANQWRNLLFFPFEKGSDTRFPLSPLMFLLVVEGLSHFLGDETISEQFKGLPISQVLYISPCSIFETTYVCVFPV